KEPPIVNIPLQGPVSGKEVSVFRGQKANVYLGIPFAKPPINPRLQPPIEDPLPSWTEVRNSTSFAPACLQDKEALREHEYVFSQILSDQIDALEFSEDCLYLNVFVPDGPLPPEKWPVVVWFHPGNFSVGTTALWDGSVLASRQKVIVVTPAYRLNILGFFALDRGISPGNYGLLDQVAALKWVNDKISEFGGSQDDICIMGHGAGATSVGLHMVSPLSKGKFNRAIAMSGSVFSNLVGNIPDIQAYKDIQSYACVDSKSNKDLIDCIRNLEVLPLVKYSWNRYPWGPVIDAGDTFLPRRPEEYFEIQKYRKVDFLTGYTDMEDAFEIHAKIPNSEKGVSYNVFKELIRTEIQSEHEGEYFGETGDYNQTCAVNVDHLLDTILFYYTPYPSSLEPEVNLLKYVDYTTEKRYGTGIHKQARFISKSSVTYVYRFDYKPKKGLVADLPEWIRVPHGFELPFFWGMPYWPSLPPNSWNIADRKVADTVMTLWTNFVKYGNPVQTGINFKWDVFEESAPSVMIIDRSFNMSDPSIFDHKAFAFWVDYYPKVIDATQCCNMTQNAIRIYSNPTLTGMLATLAGMQYLLIS
ncbi:Fatty acyl-CoA hydrolase precursor, medium chain, partial [Zootermopsis nevadensis]